MGEMTEKNKQIDKSKIKKEEKIKKLAGLLQKVHKQIEALVTIITTYIFKDISRIILIGHICRNFVE